MAHSVVTMSNGVEVKKVPLGFSWTVLFWGPIPAGMRGDFKWAAFLLGLAIITSGLSSVVAAFVYNKFYAKDLLAKGYKFDALPANVTDDTLKAYLGTIEVPHTAATV